MSLLVKKTVSFFKELKNAGIKPGEDVNMVRLTRQVNGLNLFFVFVAGSVSAVFMTFSPNLSGLIAVQLTAFLLYGFNIYLNRIGWRKLASVLTILIFEIHLFLVMLYSGGLHSPAASIIILFPLLAVLAGESITLHTVISLSQFGVLYLIDKKFPDFQAAFWIFGGINSTAREALTIMSFTYIPVMAAVIINIISKENMKARESLKQMLNVITLSKKQLEFYAVELKDETKKMRTELNVAMRIQTMVLPSHEEITCIPDLDIACMMLPADEVGGDYFDVIKTGDRVLLSIGDVTGHGLTAGVVMLMAQTAIRSLAEAAIDNPSRFLAVLNRVLYSSIMRIKEDKSMTLNIIFYKKGHYTAAGQHESIIICRKDGRIDQIDTMESGFYIGMVAEVLDFTGSIEFDLQKDDVLFLYTDGVTEAENKKKEQFGIENICLTLRKHHHLKAEEIKKKFIMDLYNYIGEADIYDDISFMIIKQK